MEIFGVVVIVVLALGLTLGTLYLLLWIIRASTANLSPTAEASVSKQDSGSFQSMNQGDFHSGPGGYSPNTAYPDTFYGSGGSSDDSNGQNEGDFNR